MYFCLFKLKMAMEVMDIFRQKRDCTLKIIWRRKANCFAFLPILPKAEISDVGDKEIGEKMDGKFWVIGNTKTEQTSLKAVENFCQSLIEPSKKFKKVKLGYAPSREALFLPAKIFEKSEVMLGAQTIGEAKSGTFTGMPCPALLKDLGVNFALINHIESMAYGWGGKSIASQIAMALDYKIFPILIVGEPVGSLKLKKEQRKKFLKKDLESLFAFKEEDLINGKLCIAYESGFIPRLDAQIDADYISSGFDIIQEIIENLGFKKVFKECRIIFGVGVSLDTMAQALAIIKMRCLGGALIGKSSVDSNEFLGIANALEKELNGGVAHIERELNSDSLRCERDMPDTYFQEIIKEIKILKIKPLNKPVSVSIYGFGEIGTALIAVLKAEDEDKIIIKAAVNNNISVKDAAARVYKSGLGIEKWETGTLPNDEIILGMLGQVIKVISVDSVEDAIKIMPETDILVFTAGNLLKKREMLEPFLKRGVKHIILTSGSPAADITIIPGFNHHLFDPKRHKIIALGSCTSNWGVPIAAITEQILGKGAIKTISVGGTHSVTNSQQIGDRGLAPKDEGIIDNLILMSSGITDILTHPDFFPNAKICGTKLTRAPVRHVSSGKIDFEIENLDISAEKFKEEFKKIAETERWKEIVFWEEEPVGTKNYRRCRAASIVFAPDIYVAGNLITIYGAYANVFGYASQIKRLIEVVGRY